MVYFIYVRFSCDCSLFWNFLGYLKRTWPCNQISMFSATAVERSDFSGLCRNLSIQSLIFKPVFFKLRQAGGGGCQLVEEEEEVTHMHWGSIQLTDWNFNWLFASTTGCPTVLATLLSWNLNLTNQLKFLLLNWIGPQKSMLPKLAGTKNELWKISTQPRNMRFFYCAAQERIYLVERGVIRISLLGLCVQRTNSNFL